MPSDRKRLACPTFHSAVSEIVERKGGTAKCVP